MSEMLLGNEPGLSCPDHAPAGLGNYTQLPTAECSLDDKRAALHPSYSAQEAPFPVECASSSS